MGEALQPLPFFLPIICKLYNPPPEKGGLREVLNKLVFIPYNKTLIKKPRENRKTHIPAERNISVRNPARKTSTDYNFLARNL